MHPAKSVIFFTTASGAGYGLIALLIAGQLSGAGSASFLLGLTGFGLGFFLITAGLLSSTFHLGHPERAWRALSQWRSSWLSREGVMAIFTYIPTGFYALIWVFSPENLDAAPMPLVGLAALISCLLTVYCTAMIYASLKPVHAWCNRWVPYGYLIISLMTGAILLAGLLHLVGTPQPMFDSLAIFLTFLALLLKIGYWHFLNNNKSESSMETATGLGRFGRVEQLESPHSQNNYLLNEMGFKIARKHASSLRRLTVVLGFVAPVVLLGSTLTGSYSALLDISASLLAVGSMAIGIYCERWLFFAEAKHSVTLYYGTKEV